MEVETQPVDANELADNCDELDDDFFNTIGQTFDVVDSWVDPDDASNSNQVPVPLIKKEKDIEEELKDSEKSKKESSSSRRDGSDSRNRDPRTRPSEKGKENGRSNSPGQKRQATAPRSNPARRSPPRKFSPRRNFPRNSPPRRNMPRNNGKQTFLEEMIHKFPEFRNQPNQVPQYNMPNAYGQQMQMQMQPSFMNQPNFIGHQNYMQPLPPGIVMDPYASTMQQFPIMNPMMMGIPGVNPLPVPAPIPVEIPPPIQLFSPLAAQNVPPGQPKKSAQRVISLEKAKAKAFSDGKIGLTDYLRQVSHQKSKQASLVDINAKKAKVLANCKAAAKMFEEIEIYKPRLPFTLRSSEKLLPSMKGDPKMGMRSPLMMSDNNMLFLSQAKLISCHDAIQANPLRNISGRLFTVCRNAGLDLVDASQKVQRKIEVEREKEMRMVQGVDISSNIVDQSKKKIHRSAQTNAFECLTCEDRMKWDEEEGNFMFRMNARAVIELSREQEGALAELCRVFNIADSRFKPVVNSQWDSDTEDHRPAKREKEDRMTYANPENPNQHGASNFLSFSPYQARLSPSPRRRSRSISPPIHSRSISPPRRRIIDRLGAKIPSPGNLRFRDDEDRLLNPAPPYRIPTPQARGYGYNKPRTRSRSRSPQRSRPREDRSRSPDRAQRRGRY